MDVAILGPLRLTVEGQDVPVPPGRQRALLAALVIDARQVVSADRLIEIVWGDDLPANPTNALQGRISQLRKLLGAGGIVQRGTGYLLDIADEQVDARRFEHLADRGHDLLVADRPDEAAAVLSDALDLWRGDALDEFADEPWVRAEATRLDARRHGTSEDRFDAELAQGRHVTVIPELERAVSENPLAERLRGQLMVALYRAGRQSDALEVFADTRRLLDEELGLDPGPELRQVHQAVLRHDERLAAPSETVRVGPPTNLPNLASSFVGRDKAVDQVRTLTAGSRIVTLTGPGGAGKTRLAIEAANGLVNDHPDGVWLIELATTRTLQEIVAFVTDAVGLAGDGTLMADAPTGIRRLVDALSSRQLLLVLDNCEHVIDEAAAFTAEVLVGCPDVRVLATSRESLGVRGEVTWSVPSLPVPLTDEADEIVRSPAVALLIDRVRSHRPELDVVPQMLRTLAEIARRLDGLPLALELAAARSRVMSLTEIANALDDRFALLTSGTRDAVPRQRTLRAVIDWSWDLLTDSQRRSWAALATFSAPFTMDDAHRLLVAADLDVGQITDVVTDLVDRSVLIAATEEDPSRYRMLETIRDYGSVRGNELGISDRVAHAHTGLVIEKADTAYPTDPDVWTLDMTAAGRLIDEALPVLHRERQRGNRDAVQRIAGSLGWVWWLRGRRDEGLGWLTWALGGGIVEPRAGLSACRLGVDLDDPPSELIVWADDAADRAEDPVDEVMATAWGALARMRRGDVEGAHDRLDGVDVAEEVTQWPAATVTLIRAIGWAVQGELDLALDGGRRAQKGYAASGAWPGEMFTADMLAAIKETVGDHTRARELRERTLDLARRHGAHEVEAVQLTRLGNLATAAGEPDEALQHHEAAFAIADRLGIGWLQVDASNAAGVAARLLGDLDVAHDHHTRAAAIAGELGHRFGSAMAHAGLGFIAEQRDQTHAALALHQQALSEGRASGETSPVILATVGLAGAVLTTGSAAEAAQLLGAADRLRAQTAGRLLRPTAAGRAGVPLRDLERVDLDRVAGAARELLGNDFDRHFQQGEQRGVPEVIDAVLAASG